MASARTKRELAQPHRLRRHNHARRGGEESSVTRRVGGSAVQAWCGMGIVRLGGTGAGIGVDAVVYSARGAGVPEDGRDGFGQLLGQVPE